MEGVDGSKRRRKGEVGREEEGRSREGGGREKEEGGKRER